MAVDANRRLFSSRQRAIGSPPDESGVSLFIARIAEAFVGRVQVLAHQIAVGRLQLLETDHRSAHQILIRAQLRSELVNSVLQFPLRGHPGQH